MDNAAAALLPDGMYHELQAAIGSLDAEMTKAQEDAERAAQQTIDGTNQFGEMKRSARMTRPAFEAYGAAVSAATADRNLSQQGRQAAIEKATAQLDADLAKVTDSMIGKAGEQLLSKFSEQPLPAMSVEASAEASVIFRICRSRVAGQVAGPGG